MVPKYTDVPTPGWPNAVPEGDQLVEQPGIPKPAAADAVGEGDVEELARDTEGPLVEERGKRSLPDIRQRQREEAPEPPPPPEEEEE
jgi:hypothetical protein